jgi:hypothetical protein
MLEPLLLLALCCCYCCCYCCCLLFAVVIVDVDVDVDECCCSEELDRGEKKPETRRETRAGPEQQMSKKIDVLDRTKVGSIRSRVDDQIRFARHKRIRIIIIGLLRLMLVVGVAWLVVDGDVHVEVDVDVDVGCCFCCCFCCWLLFLLFLLFCCFVVLLFCCFVVLLFCCLLLPNMNSVMTDVNVNGCVWVETVVCVLKYYSYICG